MLTRRRFGVVALGLMAVLLTGGGTKAAPILSISGGTDIPDRLDPFNGGYEFTTNSAITVDALGYFSTGGAAALTEDHAVALYTSTGTLLASTDVSSTHFSFVNGSFVYTAISPITLPAGGDFVVSGASGNVDPYNYDSVVTTIPEVNYVLYFPRLSQFPIY